MEHYVSFHKVLDYLKQEQQNSPRLNDFGYGDLVYFMNDSGTTTTYPFLFVTPINITYAENTTTYTLQMIFADIVNTDLSNEKDVVSDMSLEARRFLSVVKRGFLDDKIDVILPAQATTFFERFNDHVGGVVLTADITVFEDINACDPYPTPTSFNNLYAWYDFQDTSTITLTGGTSIVQVLDKSGNNHTLTPFLNPPDYSAVTTSNLVGYKAMFDHRNKNGIIHNTPLKTWTEGTIFIVSARQQFTQSIFQVITGTTSNTLTSTIGINQLTTDVTTFPSFVGRRGLVYSPFNNNDAYIGGHRVFSPTVNDSSGELYTINNITIPLTNTSLTQNINVSDYIIVGDTLYTNNDANLPILEIIMYDRALTDSEYSTVLSYLKNKYRYSTWV